MEIPKQRMSAEAMCASILDAGSVAIRDVDGGEDPFKYSSGNFGPGYVMVKSLVGNQLAFKTLTWQLGLKLDDDGIEFDNIVGNATGGMIPAYQTREDYQTITGRQIGFAYNRGTRKQGGHGELITGIEHISPTRPDGSPAHWLCMEELVNFATTTTNSLLEFRELGLVANEAATILSYDHQPARDLMAEHDVHLTSLVTLSQVLDVSVATGRYTEDMVASYRAQQADPLGWMAERGIVPEPPK